MNQLVALAVRPPVFDEPANAIRFQQYQMNQERIKNAQMGNQLGALKLGQATDQIGAENSYRSAAAAGDPNADQKLAGYPEMQKKVWDAFNGMSPKDYKAAKVKAERMGEAAKNVLMFKDGTPEQTQAWNDEIGKLAQDKIIPEEQAAGLIKSGPNPLIVEQALSVAEFAKNHDSRAVLSKTKADLAQTKEDRVASDAKAKIDQANERIALQQQRVDMAREKAGLEAQRIQSVIDKNKATTSKGSNEDAVVRDEIKSSLSAYRKNLDLTDPQDAEKYSAFRETVFKKFGFTPDGRRTPTRALGGDKVGDSGMSGPDVSDLRVPNPDRSTWDKRADGSQKGDGFLGVLKRPDGRVSSEISISGDAIGGKDYPLLVPTLTRDEVNKILAVPVDDPKFFEKIPQSAKRKARVFAEERVAAGKSPFASGSESPGSGQGDGNRPLRTATNKQTGERVQWDYDKNAWMPLK